MKISDQTKMIAMMAAVAISLGLTAFNVEIIRNACSAPAAAVIAPQGRSVRAGDVGCSRFPKSKACCEQRGDRKC